MQRDQGPARLRAALVLACVTACGEVDLDADHSAGAGEPCDPAGRDSPPCEDGLVCEQDGDEGTDAFVCVEPTAADEGQGEAKDKD